MSSTAKALTEALEEQVQDRPVRVLKVLAIVVLGILGFIIFYSLYRRVSGKGGKIKVNDADYIPGGGDVSESFLKNDVVSYLSQLEKTLVYDYYWWEDRMPRCEVLKNLYESTTENEYIAIHNAFKNQFKTTIHRLLLEKEDGCGVSWYWLGDELNFEKEYKALLIARSNKLSLP